MSILTKEIEIKVSHDAKRYYDLGYNVPTHKMSKTNNVHYTSLGNGECFSLGEKFTINVKDAPKNNISIVQCKCDNCGKIYDKKLKLIYNSKGYKLYNKTYCLDCSFKLFLCGENNSLWKPDKTMEERTLGRALPQYNIFKRNVLIRDNFKCICCGKDYKLVVHHLNGYDNFPNERFEESNGVTLCENCHKNFHFEYGRGNNTKEQFEEWFGSVKEIVSKDFCNLQEARKIYCYETDTIYQSVTYVTEVLTNGKCKKEILDCCNKKPNKFSVMGKHFFWADEVEELNEKEIINIILTDYNNPRIKRFIDLQNGMIYPNGKVCKEVNKLNHCRNLTDMSYTKENILKKSMRFVPYDTYLNFDDDLKKLVKFTEINYYKGE